MKATFAQDTVKQTPDQQVLDAAQARPGRELKLRIQPMLFQGNQYRSWVDVSWTLDCEDANEVFALRDALRLFFAAIARHGIAAVVARLKEAA